MLAALGVDLASKSWRTNGTALVAWDDEGWRNVELGVIEWPATGKPTATRLAAEIEAFCVERGVAAVGLDGPQGWMEPASPLGMRACERALTTPGKTGRPGSCRPASALPWVELSIQVFSELLAAGRAELANDPDAVRLTPASPGRFHVVECFPSSTWRRAGLGPLPPRRRRPDLAAYGNALAGAFGLPSVVVLGHDDLQALVAALPAAGVVGGPAEAVPAGRSSCETEGGLVEGLIWDAVPVRGR